MLQPMPELVTQGRRRLGLFLKELRDANGLTTEHVGTHLRQDKGTVSRYERGETPPKWPTVVMLLQHYGATEEQWRTAEALFEAMTSEPKPVRLPKGTPRAFRRLVNETRVAWRMRSIAIALVPGLLQIPEYIAALAGSLHDPESGNDKAIGIRKARQQRLHPTDPSPLRFHVLLDEICITRLVGGRDVMLKQLRFLVEVAQTWENVTLQVIPKEAGDYGAGTGGLTIVDYDDDDEPSWVYFEYPAGADLVDHPEDVQRFAKLFNNAARGAEFEEAKGSEDDSTPVALSPDRTVEFIRQQIEVLEADEVND